MSIHCIRERDRGIRNSTLTRLHPLLATRAYVTSQEGSFYACPRRETIRTRLSSCHLLQKGRRLLRTWFTTSRHQTEMDRRHSTRTSRGHEDNRRRVSIHIHVTSEQIGSTEHQSTGAPRRRSPQPLRVVVWTHRYGEITPSMDDLPRTLRQANQQMVGRIRQRRCRSD